MSFNWTPDELQEIVDNNPIVLFMKGTPEQPRCGFSNRAATVLGQLEQKWASIDVFRIQGQFHLFVLGPIFQQCLRFSLMGN